MLTILNDTMFDSRTPLEKQLDMFIENQNKTKRLNDIIVNYSLLPIPVLALNTLNGNIESIASFCKGVNKFFSTCWLILTNIPTFSYYICLALTMVGFVLYSLFHIYEGKKVAVISTTVFILIRLIASCLG